MADSKLAIKIDFDNPKNNARIVEEAKKLGVSTMTASTKAGGKLSATIDQLSKSGADGGEVANSLISLQKEMRDLDPSGIDFTRKGLWAKIFNPIKGYFAKYQKSEQVIGDIIGSLENGKKVLENDNKTLQEEQKLMMALTERLKNDILEGEALAEAIREQKQLAIENGADLDFVKKVETDLEFPVAQRLMDMNQMLAVNQQGIAAFNVLIQNNDELINEVRRASTVTVSAMRVAVTVAAALYNQSIVLKRIEALNQTTDNLIAGTARMLKEQGTAIQKKAISTSISVESLKQAFSDTLSALEDINNFKAEALPKMYATISEFKGMIQESENRLAAIEGFNINEKPKLSDDGSGMKKGPRSSIEKPKEKEEEEVEM